MRLQVRLASIAFPLLLCAAFVHAESVPIAPEKIEFFEKKIRPVLAERCYTCHSAKSEKLKGELLLDSREGMLKGGRSGVLMVLGNPDKSLLVTAVRWSDDELLMPPKKKLSAEQIADFEAWVKMGAPDPRVTPTATAGAAVKDHWAFKAPQDGPIPAVKDESWCKTPLDRFVLAKLEQKGLKPAPRAEKRTLLRRATYDLTGLPPTSEEIEAFEADNSPQAFATVVDRLLASPRYGERWGRYWLDVARYADTKGYVFEEERRYPYSYTYRDWVIQALNEDMPYDKFLVQQIAADRLPLGDDKHALAAMGFLTLGRRFLNQQPDIIDDRIDVVTRGTMGLTVTCARCHDHKFDPIPTKDYYSLYGVFASSTEPTEPPLLGQKEKTADNLAYEKELAVREDVVKKFLEQRRGEIQAELKKPEKLTEILLAASDARTLGDKELHEMANKRNLNVFVLRRWRDFLNNPGASEERQAVFGPLQAFGALPANEFAAKVATVKLDQTPMPKKPQVVPVNPLVAQAFAKKAPASMHDVAASYAALLASVDKPAAISDPPAEKLRLMLCGPDAAANIPAQNTEEIFNGDDHKKLRDKRKPVDELKATHPGAPARAMSMMDLPAPVTAHVFKRGNPQNVGDEVPRQFLGVLSGPNRQPFKQGSGRLELAQAIASKDNPLTARVMANRIWLHHFGAGLVRTPSDFGTRSERPVQPELLDYLATHFMAEGWSIKQLHRLIMSSSVYQQGSMETPECAKLDPENTLLSHTERTRLDFEALRDSLLATSGQLDLGMGGRSFDLSAVPFTKRRTVYGFIDRQNLPNLFRAFDFASPDATSAQRFVTTVPQQALFMMNSPFVLEQAKALAARSEAPPPAAAQPDATQETARLQRLYRLVYQRAATEQEAALGLKFIHAVAEPVVHPTEVAPAWQFGYGEYNAIGERVKTFTPLKHFTGTSWQAGPAIPDSELGWIFLGPQGGHPGNDGQHAAIRRWIAPMDGEVTVRGKLSHGAKEGDGIQGFIVSSRLGKLGNWVVHAGSAATNLEHVKVVRGDTIDFVVDPRENPGYDSFEWSPIIHIVNPANNQPGQVVEWNAATDFNPEKKQPTKALTPWEKYAQVLLQANEFDFVD